MRKKSVIPDAAAVISYCDLLEKLVSDLDQLAYEVDSQVIHNLVETLPVEIKFDGVPIYRKIKEAQKTAEASLRHYRAIKDGF